MEEVKDRFKKRQYRNCSTRCIQILDSINDPNRTHPLYLTWMSFYAAASLEQISRSLHITSNDKLPFLQQSLSYYEKAESYLEIAPFFMDPVYTKGARQHSSSVSSSMYSPAPPSPSREADSCKAEPDKSRTISPRSRPNTTKPRSKPELPPVLIYTNPLPPSPTQTPSPNTPDFLLSRSITRYHKHLSGMQTQLRYHIGSVNTQIVTLQELRKARRSNRPNLFAAFSASGIDGMDMMELRRVDLKARIEKWREVGWKRERFNGEKYRKLCEQALAELD